ncbi:MAG: hypothetical protein IJ618_10750 [Prevotella sp.]|nr:hypothetical protein [Prevotella sp.]
MKKNIYCLLALIGLLGSSCSNEEINIESEQYIPSHLVTFNVESNTPYEKFGVIDGIKSKVLSDGSHALGVFTFIFDEDGERVDSVFSHSDTFSPMTQELTLKEGNYWLVSIETIVNKNYNFTPDSWNLINSEKITTCEMRLKEGEKPLWYELLGAATGSLVIDEEHHAFRLTPNPIGALVDVDYFNFDQSDYQAVAFVTKNEAIGVKFSSVYKDDYRFTWDNYNSEEYVALRGWEIAQDKLLEKDGFTLYLLEDGRINCGLAPIAFDADGKPKSFNVYPSANYYLTVEKGGMYYAGINYKGGKEGNDCESFVGDSFSDYADWQKNITPPTPTTDSDLYKAPYTTWGETVASVKSYMKDFSVYSDIQIGSNGMYWMSYIGTGNVLMYEYDFKTETTGLDAAYVYLNQNKVTYADIDAYIKRKGYSYDQYDSENQAYYYTNETTMVAVLNRSDIGWIVLYVNRNSSSSGLTFKEPYTTWGASVSNVKSYMSSYTLYSDIRANSTGDYYMLYNGKDDELLYQYDFSSQTTGLHDAYVAFESDKFSIDDFSNYFKNNSAYAELKDYSDSGYEFWGTYSTDGKTGVLVNKNSNNLWVLNYFDMSVSSIKKHMSRRVLEINNVEYCSRKKINIPKGNLCLSWPSHMLEDLTHSNEVEMEGVGKQELQIKERQCVKLMPWN